MLEALFTGTGGHDIAYTAMRVSVGAFYAIAGAHKLLRREDHAHLVGALKRDIGFAVPFFAWFVPSVEFMAGSAVVLGLLTPLAALGIMIVSLVALVTDERRQIPDMEPTDEPDWVDDYLYLPSCLYAIMLAVVIAYGSGPYGLDAIIRALIVGAN